jgi:hypothetical protein
MNHVASDIAGAAGPSVSTGVIINIWMVFWTTAPKTEGA